MLRAYGLKEVTVRCPISAHPAKAGIQRVCKDLDARFRGHERNKG